VGRREFLGVFGGTVAWPLMAQAQQPPRIRRIGYVTPGFEDEPRIERLTAAFERGLGELGWTVGRDLLIDKRYGAVNPEVRERHVREMLALRPEAVLAHTATTVLAILRQTNSLPIVFVDSLGEFIADRSHPGGNVTGFINFEDSLFGKWVQLLKEIAPQTSRLVYLLNPENATKYGIPQIDAAARALNIEVSPAPVREPAEIETALALFSAERGGGAVVLPGPFVAIHRKEIFAAAIKHRVPVVYPSRSFVDDGGLLAYGVDESDLFRRSSVYIDRILRGANPGELPVQAPTKFELAVNLRTAKEIGVEVPQSILIRADDVVE
jgi:putative tryptophan/tyrosine transport system substrate-binding protein